jgi:hypothetical protein
MIINGNIIAAAFAVVVLGASAAPVYAGDAIHASGMVREENARAMDADNMDAARARALEECSKMANGRYSQGVWLSSNMAVYRNCMVAHKQPE